MPERTARSTAVLQCALDGDDPNAALLLAEQIFMSRRRGPPGVRTALHSALKAALGGIPPASPLLAAAFAMADAVERHGAGFEAGAEPAYHDRYHQAETVLAMGWLAGAARRLGLLDVRQVLIGLAAMTAHDLLHDGRVHGGRGVLERRSARAAAHIAEAAGVDAEAVAALRRTILATTWPWAAAEAPDLLCRLAREADLFGSTLPRHGPRLSRLLAMELATAGQADPTAVASHASRLGLLRLMPPPSEAARILGLDRMREGQIAAYGRVAARLGLVPPAPEAGAAALDGMSALEADTMLAEASGA